MIDIMLALISTTTTTDPFVIVGFIALFCTTVWNGIAQGIAARKKAAKDEADALQSKIDRQQMADIQKTGQDVHTLTNSAMGVTLKLSAAKSKQIYMLLKRLAELTKDPGDISAVDIAQADWITSERVVGKHEGQQETVDASGKA
jgi:hypothetical protein